MPSRGLCNASALGFVLVLFLVGCGGGGSSPLSPDMNQPGTGLNLTPDQPIDRDQNGLPAGFNDDRYIWGMWDMHVNADHTAIEAVPIRSAAFHLNIVGYLENPPGTQLLQITNLSFSQNDTLLVDIQLRHPFSGSKFLTGFDVRGIAILPAQRLFQTQRDFFIGTPEQKTEQLYASRQLVNADGYTTLWNRHTAKLVQHPNILGYIIGRLATKDEAFIEGNLHGFKAFWTDPQRRVFQANQANTRTYEFDFPPGPLSFAYAVDCSWEPPDVTPVVDVWADFPASANSMEPYQMSASIISNTLTRTTGQATIQFEIFDWQDAQNLSSVTVEAPAIFGGVMNAGPPIASNPQSATYEVTIMNTTGSAVTANGGSDFLVIAEDAANSIVNPDLTAYQIFKIPVQDVPGFWRDRNGDGSYVNTPIVAPLIQPSTLSVGMPDLAIVSYPRPQFDFFNGDPELLLFDDDDSRFIVLDRELNSTAVKSGYPYQTPPSWLRWPQSMDTTQDGWYGVGSSNDANVVANYKVKHLVNIFKQDGTYGFSWYTGSDDGGPNAFLESVRDVTAGFGNNLIDPIIAQFAYVSGTPPSICYVLAVGDPYVEPDSPNVFRTSVPRSNAAGAPQAIWSGAPRLRCAIDSDPPGPGNPGGLLPGHYGYYVLESDPGGGTSELEGFDINFQNIPTEAVWNLTDADITTEFPGAHVVDIEVVPSHYNEIEIFQGNTADYNWLCVVMMDNTHYWLAFYDPLNPTPDNPGNNPLRSIYTSNQIPIVGGAVPVAMDVDLQYFEVYVLCKNPAGEFYITPFEFFY
ncbi:MAG TPA: hypothetical protein VGB30_14940 [bacterium]|jgi:hypothetical protein